MNYDYSIENSIEKIQNINTHTYFKEVYQTFVNGNYRSSIVMLYSVLICDLVYKLRDLRDIYIDAKAKKILEEIEAMQMANPTSPEWETKLIEAIKTRTSLLESSDIVAIESLQKFRHLSAHPILNNADLLYTPNRDTAQALIRNILDGVLTNPPFFSNKIFDVMLLDMAEVKDKITDKENLKRYVNSRYIKKLKENDFKKIYRSLWKVVFMTTDKDSVDNRNINYRVLRIFAEHDRSICVQLLRNEPAYYNNISKDDQVGLLIHLLASFPEMYIQLDTPLKLLIEKKIIGGEYQFISWFIKPTLKEHLTSLNLDELGDISKRSFKYIKEISINNDCLNELINFALNYFQRSINWSDAQVRFDTVIENIKNDLNLEQTERLLEISDNSSQIYKSWETRPKIKSIAENYDGQIDKNKYKSIYST